MSLIAVPGRISGVEMLEEFDELSLRGVSDGAWTFPVSMVDSGNRLSVPWRLSLVIPREARVSRARAQIRAVVAMAWIPGFSS